MKKIFSIVVCVFSVQICKAQSFDTKNIQLDLQFDWKKKQAFGTATITFSTVSDKIYLDAGFLSIETINQDNKEISFNYDGSDTGKLEILLERKYGETETKTIVIKYHTNYVNESDPNAIGGSFGKGLRFMQPTSTTPNKHKQIWSCGEPTGNKYWFPCNEDITDRYNAQIIGTVEQPMILISNGSLKQTVDNKNDTRTFYYQTDQALPTYLISIVVGEYKSVNQKYDSTPIRTYGYPNEVKAVKATVELVPEMMHFLQSKTAYKYPFKNYTQVVVQDYPFPGATGQHMATLLSDNYIDDHGVHQDFKYLWDGVAVQAMANQWFGNLIQPKSWQDVWLNHAFGEYFAGLFTEQENSRAEYLLWYYLPFEKAAVIGDWQAKYVHPIVSDQYKSIENYSNVNDAKLKGAMVLRMLQHELGEEIWWKAIQLYVRQNAGKQVTTNDFQDAIEKISGKSYQWFFDQWIYKVGLPKLLVSQRYDETNKKITLSIKQNAIQDSAKNYEFVSFFQGKIDVEIDGKIIPFSLKPQAENIFTYTYKDKPKYVNFNYEETFLCEVEIKQTTEDYFTILKNSKDYIAKQRAIDNLVLSCIDTTFNIKEKVIEAIRNEIQSSHYWRYRMYAIGSLRKIVSTAYDEQTIAMLSDLIKKEQGWLKTSAIAALGNTKDKSYFEIYKDALNDKSDRVVNAAAIAIGKCKHLNAKITLLELDKKPSWKNQSRISALNGLQQLNDTTAIHYVLDCIEDNTSPRWYLATPTWDYPFAAVNTLVSYGKGYLAYPILLARFKKSLDDNDINDIFQNVQLIDLLKDKRAGEMYHLLKEHFEENKLVLEAISNYEAQYLESIK